MTWMPIDSAPMDGTIVDVWIELFSGEGGYRQTNAKYIDGKWCRNVPIAGWMNEERFGLATHWMALPEKPNENI